MKAPLYSLLNLAEAEGSPEELFSNNRVNEEGKSKLNCVAQIKSVVVDGNQCASEVEYEGKEAYPESADFGQKAELSLRRCWLPRMGRSEIKLRGLGEQPLFSFWSTSMVLEPISSLSNL